MPNEFWAAIVGAVIGAIAGGIMAYYIQLKALRASSENREKDSKERKMALGYALLFKMVRIHTTIKHMQIHMTECLGKLQEEEYAEWEPWQVTLPVANLAESIHFSTDEMAMLLALKDDDLFNDLSSFDVIHNSTIELFRTFSNSRISLLAMLPANMDGMVGEIRLSQEQAMYVRPKMVELNSLILSINERCIQDEQAAWNVLGKLNEILNDKLELAVSVASKLEADA